MYNDVAFKQIVQHMAWKKNLLSRLVLHCTNAIFHVHLTI